MERARERIVRLLKMIDEGFILTVSRTGLAWSVVLLVVSIIYYTSGNTLTYQEKALKILTWVPFIVAVCGFWVGLNLIILRNENRNKFIEFLPILSGVFAIISAYTFLLAHDPWPWGVIAAVLLLGLLLRGFLLMNV